MFIIKPLTKEEFINLYENMKEGELRTIWINDHINPNEADYSLPMDLFYTQKIMPCFLFDNDELKMISCQGFKNSDIKKIKRQLLSNIYDEIIPYYASEIYTEDMTEELGKRAKSL